jgi:hypothetical protein
MSSLEMKFEVLTVWSMMVTVVWHVTLYSRVEH